MCSQTKHSRFLDEISVANQLMALAGTPTVSRQNMHVIPAAIRTEEVISSMECPPESYEKESDVVDDYVPPQHMPQNLQELIQLEHCYAMRCSNDDFFEEKNESELPSILSMQNYIIPVPKLLNDGNISSSNTLDRNPQKNFEVSKPVSQKEHEQDNKYVFNDKLLNMYISRVNAQENKLNFQKKLKIVKDCQNGEKDQDSFKKKSSNKATDSFFSSDEELSNSLTSINQELISESDSDNTRSADETEAFSSQIGNMKNFERMDTFENKLSANISKNHCNKKNEKTNPKTTRLTNVKRKQPQLYSRNKKLYKEEIKEKKQTKIVCRKKAASTSESVSSEFQNALESDLTPVTKKRRSSVPSESVKLRTSSDVANDVETSSGSFSKRILKRDVSKNKQKDLTKLKKTVSLSRVKRPKEKGNKIVTILQQERKKKLFSFSEDSFIDAKILNLDKEVLEVKESIPLCPITPKHSKKKTLKRESTKTLKRLVLNENEPPLFSQPDKMVKVGNEDAIKKEKEEELCHSFGETEEYKDYNSLIIDKKDITKTNLDKKLKNDSTVKYDELKDNNRSNNVAEVKTESDIKNTEMKSENSIECAIDAKNDVTLDSVSSIKENIIKNDVKNITDVNFISEVKIECSQKSDTSLSNDSDFEEVEKIELMSSSEEIDNKGIINLSEKTNDPEAKASTLEISPSDVIEKDEKFEECNHSPMTSNATNVFLEEVNDFNVKDDCLSPLLEDEDFSDTNLSIDIPLTDDSDFSGDCEIKEDKNKMKVIISKEVYEPTTSIKPEIIDSSESIVDDTPKPERKSHRLIKKKEFFEFVSEPPCVLQTKKSNSQKQKIGKSKDSGKKNSLLSIAEEISSSEDDPDKLWCICRKPHNNRFMIQCDTCEDWFHGKCVGVTKQQGCQLEKLQKEWICPTCRSKDQLEIITKESTSGREIKKNPNKNHNIDQKKISTEERVNQIVKKENSSCNSNLSKSLKFDNSLTSLANKSQKDETAANEDATDRKLKAVQKKLQEQINVLSRKTKKGCGSSKVSPLKNINPEPQPKVIPTSQNLSSNAEKNSLNNKGNVTTQETLSVTIASPKKKPLPVSKPKLQGVKTLPKKRQNCVQCQKSTVANSCYCSSECIEKHVAECLKGMQDNSEFSKTLDINSQKLVVFDRFKGNVITGEKRPTVGEIVSWLKENPSFMIVCSPSFVPGKKKESAIKKDGESCSNTEQKEMSKANDLAKANVRVNVKKTLKNILMERCKNSEDIFLPEEEIRKIAVKIEEELFTQFKDTNLKYRTKYRSLMFNIKDPRNQGLFRKILRGEISPNKVVHMTPAELASVELSKWREQEMQHHLDMIKRVQLEQQKSGNSLLIKKTHKGEVEIEDDFTTIIEQDILKSPLKIDNEDNLELEKELEVANDTTHLHRSHLFDLNCKICTGKVTPPTDENTLKKVRVAHSISVDVSSPNTGDSVEKAVSRIVEGKSPVSGTDDSSDQEPSSTVSLGSPGFSKNQFFSENISQPAAAVWKGFILMQDIAKFVCSGYKVSGQTDRLFSDLPDTIQVCGRIIPDQVWDYLSKIKQSGNKELIIIQFHAANEEEAATYESFYSYLNSRKRYGVVSNYSKKIKDFYIVPLAATSPVPTILMPFDGPGLPSPRPHLLLGVIVRHRVKQVSHNNSLKQKQSKIDAETDDGSYTPPFELRSYTPPLPAQVLTSENKSKHLSKGIDEDKPYDPEQDVFTESSKNQDRIMNEELKIKNSPSTENLDDHKKILDALTKQVEKTDREVSALKNFVSNPKINNNSPDDPKVLNSVIETGMTSFLDLPSNLKEILNTVRMKAVDNNSESDSKGDVDMRINTSSLHRVINVKKDSSFHNQSSSTSYLFEQSTSISEEKSNILGATPPPPEDYDKSTVNYPSDPRIKLRTSFQDTTFQLEKSSDSQIPTSSTNQCKNIAAVPGRLFPVDWNQYKEPPPPGIEPSELLIGNIFSSKSDNSGPLPPKPPHYPSTTLDQEAGCSVTSGFPSPAIPFPSHLPPVFSVHPPPPLKTFSTSNIVPPSFTTQPLPVQTLPSGSTDAVTQDQWPVLPSTGYQSEKSEWSDRSSQWNDDYSSDISSNYRHDQRYKRRNFSSKHWEKTSRYSRDSWHKRPERSHKYESRRGKRGNNYRKNRRI